MAETLRDLVVSLSLQSDDFSKNITMVNKQLQEAQSKFALASAGVSGFEKTTSGLSSKLTMLKTKQDLQNKAVEQYKRALNAANDKLERAAKSHDKLNAELDEAREKEADVKKQLDGMKAAYKEQADAAEGDAAAAALLSEKIAELEAAHKEAKQEVSEFEKKLTVSSKSMRNTANNISDMSAKLNYAEAEMKEISQEIEDTSAALAKMESLWGKAEKALTSYSKGAAKVGEATAKVGSSLTKGVTAPVVALGTYALKSEVEFESAFAGVRKTVNATESEYKQLEQSIKDMTLEIPSTTEDLSGVMEIAGQLGILKKNLADYTETVVNLDNTTNLSAEDAASQIAQFSNVTGMAQEKVKNFGSTLVALGNNFATTESDIMNMATRLGAAGSQVGLTEAQILAYATALSSVGLEAEAGGTAFSKAMIEMQVAVETGNKSLADFANVSGMTVEAFTALWKSNPAAAIESFIVGLSTMNEAGISSIVTLQELGFTEVRLRDTLLRASNASELFSRAQTMANAAWEENTALSAEASVRYETLESQLQILKNRVSLAAQSLGHEMAPMTREAVGDVSELIDRFMALDTRQKEQIVKWAAIAAAAGPALTVFGKTITISGKMASAVKVIGTALTGLGSTTVLGAGAAVLGVTALISGMNALMDTTPKYKKAMDELFDTVDEKKLDNFNKAYETTLTADVKVEPGSVQVESLYDDIEKALTDGLPDTPEVINELENKVRDYYGGQVENINKWVNEEIAKLDVNSETYDADVENIKAKGAEMVAELEAQQTATIDFINSASGQSTSNVILSGVSMNEETAGRAFAYARKTYEDNMGALRAEYEAELKKLESLGTAAYEAGIGDLEAGYAAQKDAVLTAYQNELSALLNGLGDAFEKVQPELAAKMRETAEALDLQEQVQAIMDKLSSGEKLESSDISNDLAKRIGAAAGIDTPEALAEQINGMLDGTKTANGINISAFLEELSATIGAGVESMSDEDFGGLAAIFSGLITKGVTDGIEDIDLTTSEGKLLALFTDVGVEIPESISQGIADNISTVVEETKALAEETKEAADSQTDEYYGIGTDIVFGLTNGINEKRGYAVAAAKALAKAVEEAARVQLDTHSPSRVAEDIGKDFGEGFKVGLENPRMIEAVKKASRYLTGSAVIGAKTETARGMTDARNQSVNVTIENYNASSEQDAETLARGISSMTRKRNRGYGLNA